MNASSSSLGNFQAGDSGSILKKLCPKEHKCLNKLMVDILRPYVPEYKGDVEKDGESILQQDQGNVDVHVMKKCPVGLMDPFTYEWMYCQSFITIV